MRLDAKFENLLVRRVPEDLAIKAVAAGLGVTRLKTMAKNEFPDDFTADEITKLKVAVKRKPISRDVIHRFIFECDWKCCVCFDWHTIKPLILHHIDSHARTQNDSYDNLALICLHCHALAHTTSTISLPPLPPELIRSRKSEWIKHVANIRSGKISVPAQNSVQSSESLISIVRQALQQELAPVLGLIGENYPLCRHPGTLPEATSLWAISQDSSAWRNAVVKKITPQDGMLGFKVPQPDKDSLSARLRLATQTVDQELLSSEELESQVAEALKVGLQKFKLGMALLGDRTSDWVFTRRVLIEAKGNFKRCIIVPDVIMADIDLGLAVAELEQAGNDLTNKRMKEVRRHLESALPIMRVHSARFGPEVMADSTMILALCELDHQIPRRYTKSQWTRASALLLEAIHWIRYSERPDADLKRADFLTLLATAFHQRETPDWACAIQVVREAIDIYDGRKSKEKLIGSLRRLAWICQSQPEPDYGQAELSYKIAIERFDEQSDKKEKADTLALLADCVNYGAHFANNIPDWAKLIEIMGEAVGLWRQLFVEERQQESAAACLGANIFVSEASDCGNTLQKGDGLSDIARTFLGGALDFAALLELLPAPNFEQAANLYGEVLDALPESWVSNRASTAFKRAYALHNQPIPNYCEAIHCSRLATNCFRKGGHPSDVIASVQQLVYLFSESELRTPDEWQERIDCYRELVTLQSQPLRESNTKIEPRGLKRARLHALATAHFNFAFWMQSHLYWVQPQTSDDDWREAFLAASNSSELFRSVGDQQGWIDAVRLGFRIVSHCTKVCHEDQIVQGRRALKYLRKYAPPEQRIDLLYCLATVLITKPRCASKEALSLSKEAVLLLRQFNSDASHHGESYMENVRMLSDALKLLGDIYLIGPPVNLEEAAICHEESKALQRSTGS